MRLQTLHPSFGLLAAIALLLVSFLLSLQIGIADVTPAQVLAAFLSPEGRFSDLVVLTERLPRAGMAVAVGASLATAGVLLQGLTQNPLAAPSLLGVNAGAALGVVAATSLNPNLTPTASVSFAFLGGLVAAGSVLVFASLGRGGTTPMRLILAGIALSSLLISLTTAILILDERTLDEVRVWLVGTLANRDPVGAMAVLPWAGLAFVGSLLLARSLSVLSLGRSAAAGLGVSLLGVEVAALTMAVVLSSSAVAIAGSVGFVGLFVPHLARFVVGSDFRWLIPASAVAGGWLLLVADAIARSLVPPQEVPVGILTAALGTPLFVYLARRG